MKTLRFAALLVLASTLPLAAQQIQISKENKTIAITTSDDASALADTAIVTIGFNVYGKDQDGTYANATVTSNSVIAALTKAGIPKEAIQSASQSLSPLNPGNDEDKARYAQGLRFEFEQSWRVTIPADQASNTLHLAITSGANNSGGIQWQLQHDDALEAEAAQKALEHARQIAERMAKGLGSKLGDLVYASNQSPPRGIFANMGFGGMMLNTESASAATLKTNLKPLAISPERITKSATVYAVFAIE
ncbi:MAG TPA: SIMPL domain-containing protein [Granulicella sp.]|jgi:hypothetical protein